MYPSPLLSSPRASRQTEVYYCVTHALLFETADPVPPERISVAAVQSHLVEPYQRHSGPPQRDAEKQRRKPPQYPTDGRWHDGATPSARSRGTSGGRGRTGHLTRPRTTEATRREEVGETTAGHGHHELKKEKVLTDWRRAEIGTERPGVATTHDASCARNARPRSHLFSVVPVSSEGATVRARWHSDSGGPIFSPVLFSSLWGMVLARGSTQGRGGGGTASVVAADLGPRGLTRAARAVGGPSLSHIETVLVSL